MTSSSSDIQGSTLASGSRTVLYLLLVSMCLTNSSMLLAPAKMAWADGAQTAKERIIQGILSDFQVELYTDPKKRGKAFQVVIKDFSLDDEKTYAIIDELNYFLVISIPDKKENPLCGEACSNIFRLSRVRKDLVELTRAQGFRRKFTVPLREEDLPFTK